MSLSHEKEIKTECDWKFLPCWLALRVLKDTLQASSRKIVVNSLTMGKTADRPGKRSSLTGAIVASCQRDNQPLSVWSWYPLHRHHMPGTVNLVKADGWRGQSGKATATVLLNEQDAPVKLPSK